MRSSIEPQKISTSPRRRPLRSLRKLHLYFGLFIAPSLLFFAFTGALQTLSLHEAAGRSYTPPNWILRLSRLHKDQTVALPPPRKAAPASSPSSSPPAAGKLRTGNLPTALPAQHQPPPETLAGKEAQHLPEKLFFLVVALGLCSSTLTGIYMAYKYERAKLLVSALLLAGILVPLVLLPF